MQIMDAVFEHRDGGESQSAICTCEATTGISPELLVELLKAYRARRGTWRAAIECDLAFVPAADLPTIVCRMLDILAGQSHNAINSLSLCTTLWSDYGVSDHDKQIILSVYLEHSWAWHSHHCEDRMLPQS